MGVPLRCPPRRRPSPPYQDDLATLLTGTPRCGSGPRPACGATLLEIATDPSERRSSDAPTPLGVKGSFTQGSASRKPSTAARREQESPAQPRFFRLRDSSGPPTQDCGLWRGFGVHAVFDEGLSRKRARPLSNPAELARSCLARRFARS
jgi:hypothetical protein